MAILVIFGSDLADLDPMDDGAASLIVISHFDDGPEAFVMVSDQF